MALEQFAGAGSRGTSVAQVAARAGLSQAPHVVRLVVTLGTEALDPERPAHQWVQDHYESLGRAAVEHGRERGEFRPDTPVTTLVRLTIAAMDGLRIQWLVGAWRST